MARELSRRQVDQQLDAIRAAFSVKQKTIDEDFKRAEQEVTSSVKAAGLGILSIVETLLVKATREYARDFAFVGVGGQAFIMKLTAADPLRSLVRPREFAILHRNDSSEITNSLGEKERIYPAEEFIKNPPPHTAFFRGGFVFCPSGTVAADEYNLYRGMRVRPDASGSCAMFRELITTVWAANDKAACGVDP